MSAAVQKKLSCSNSEPSGPRETTGFLVIEQRASTPLGPRIVYANEELLRLSGYESTSLIGSPFGLLYDRNDLTALLGKLQAIATRSTHCYMDRVLQRNGGSRLPCRWTIRPTNRNGELAGYFALTVRPMLPEVDDLMQSSSGKVTPPKREERRFAAGGNPDSGGTGRSGRSNYESDRSESISLTAAGVAHDFKNALQAIKTNLELASLASAPGSRARNHVQEAHLALGDAEMLAQQMLAFTKGESAGKRVIQISHLLDRVSRLCFAGSGICCRLYVPAALRCVEGDPTKIYQVLHNLVMNARQAMPNGGTIDLVAANADLQEPNQFDVAAGNYTVVSVRDRGCGIEPENLKRVFDPDFSTKLNGSGLGLASCQAIVTSHGGAIRVGSEVGVGTEFLVFLPSTDQVADLNPVILPPPLIDLNSPGREYTSSTGRILVVEDQPGVARATVAMLQQMGFDCLHAGNGEGAIDLYREHSDTDEPIDLVLLDMTLPGGLTGAEVAAEIWRLDRNARILATSGYFEQETSLSSFRNFAGVLPKPYSKEE